VKVLGCFKKRYEDENITCSACGKNGHSIDQCWFEHPDEAPKHLRMYFLNKKLRGDSSATQEVHLTEAEAETPSDPLDWLNELD